MKEIDLSTYVPVVLRWHRWRKHFEIEIRVVTENIVAAVSTLHDDDLSGKVVRIGDVGWRSPVARTAHTREVDGSNPSPATTKEDGSHE